MTPPTARWLTAACAAYSAPSVTVDGGATTVAVQGPDHELQFYWAINGTSTWHAETVAGAGSTYSAPSMTVNGNSATISAVGASNRLKFYWKANGSPVWHAETAAGPGSVR